MADDVIACPECKKNNKIGRKKCMFCGANLPEGSAPATGQTPATPAPNPPTTPAPTTAPVSPTPTPAAPTDGAAAPQTPEGTESAKAPPVDKSRDKFLKIKTAEEEEKEKEAEKEPEEIDCSQIIEENFYGFPLDRGTLEQMAPLVQQKEIMDAKEFMEFVDAAGGAGKPVAQLLLEYQKCTVEQLAELEADHLQISFINLTTYSIEKKIAALLKEDFCKMHNVIPVSIGNNDLVTAMIDPSDQAVITEIATLTGLGVKPCKTLKAPLLEQLNLLFPKTKIEERGKKQAPKRLGDILLDLKILTKDQLEKALATGKEKKKRIGEVLLELNLASNKQISLALSKQYGLPYIDLDESLVDPIVADILPKKLCYEYFVCPVKFDKKTITIAIEDPTNIVVLDHIKMMSHAKVELVIANNASIKGALDKLFGESDQDLMASFEGGEDGEGGDPTMGDFGEDSAPIVKLVNMAISDGVKQKVSDIHFEPFEYEVRIRYRKDGSCIEYMKPPKSAYLAVVSRIKVMANLDIAENRLPQDGRISMKVAKKKIDLRVSILPCVWGEKVVMRICDQENLKVNLKELGFEPMVFRWFSEALKSPNGVVLVTGPTGSGKTTTLYSALTAVNKPGENIMTAEDPAEFNLPGINQVNCNADIGLTFGSALRSFLRQDPDIIMVGEIRDFETASIAFKAAMTGHLVLSTLHTNDAPGTVGRLLQMGIEPFMVTTAVRVVEAQRLVKLLCQKCKEPYTPSEEEKSMLNISTNLLKKMELDEEMKAETIQYWKAKGCDACHGKGTAGRMGIYEVMRMSERVRTVVLDKGSPELLRMTALADGMLSLRESATFKLLKGMTNLENVLGSTRGEENVELDEKGIPIVRKRYTRTQLKGMGILDIEEHLKKSPREQEEIINKLLGKPSTSAPVPPPPAGAAPGSAVIVGAPLAVGANPALFTDILGELKSLKTQLSQSAIVSSAKEGTPSISSSVGDNMKNLAVQIKNQSGSALKPSGDEQKDTLLRQSIFLQASLLERNMENLAWFMNPPITLQPVKAAPADLVEKYLFGEFKNFLNLARVIRPKTPLPKIALGKAFQENLPAMVVDGSTLKSILRELALNSILAIATEGQFKVTLQYREGFILLQLMDNGKGIPADQQAQLFTPYYSTFNSNGLGLATCKRLIETIYGGRISIKSQEGKATVVDIQIPADGRGIIHYAKARKAS